MVSESSPTGGERDSGELIRAARRDPEAFAALFDRHAPRMQRWLLGKVGEPASANDLLAETFAQAWRSCPRFRGRGEEAGAAWLYGIARNLVRRHHRTGRIDTAARRRLGMPLQSGDDGGIEAAVERLDAGRLRGSLDAAYAHLPQEQRAALGYRVLDGLSYEEIAATLECSPVTARTRVHRGLRALRSAIERGADS